MPPRGRKPAVKAKPAKEELFDDEVDEFHSARDKLRDHISLEDGSGDEDDEDDDESDERLGDTYGLGGDSDEDSEEDDDEDDESSEEEIKVPGARLDLDDGDEDDDEEAGIGAPRWGKKSAYYGADDADEDSSDVGDGEGAAELEEKAALEEQARQLGVITEEDVKGPSFGEKVAAAAKPAAPVRARTAMDAVAGGAFETAALRGEKVAKLDRRARSSSGAAASAGGLVGDEALSADERLAIVSRDAPELLMLLSDLKSKLDETRSRVAPLVAAATSGELRVGGGLGYLQTKLQLLLSYCTHISFFLALKASGAAVHEHPVIAQLVRLRAVLEKLGPLDKKLRFQVDRLLQLAAAEDGTAAPNGRQAGGARPNPRALISKRGEGGGEEEAEGEEGARAGAKAGKDGIYRPPKLAAVEYDGDLPGGLSKTARKAERDQARRLERASRSALVRELRNEFGDEPEELAAVDLATGPRAIGGASERLAREEEERRAYEEEHFVRLQLTKKQKRQQRQLKADGGLDLLDRFDDLTPLLRDGAAAAHAAGIDVDAIVGASAGDGGKKRKGAKGGGAGARFGNDDDDDAFLDGDLDGIRLPAGGLGGGDDDEDVAGGLADYEEVARAAKDRKRARAEDRKAATLDALQANAPDDEMDGDKRAVGRDIVKNKGLTRHRKKLDRNVRTKNREKFRRAVIKRKGQVRDVQQKPSDYGGEATGIKRNVSHSRRFA